MMLGSNDGKGANWNETTIDAFEKKYSGYLDSLSKLPSNPKVYAMVPPPVLPCYNFSHPDKLNGTVIN